jgi:hypothetical protein
MKKGEKQYKEWEKMIGKPWTDTRKGEKIKSKQIQ